MQGGGGEKETLQGLSSQVFLYPLYIVKLILHAAALAIVPNSLSPLPKCGALLCK